jgi:hypothetical protein
MLHFTTLPFPARGRLIEGGQGGSHDTCGYHHGRWRRARGSTDRSGISGMGAASTALNRAASFGGGLDLRGMEAAHLICRNRLGDALQSSRSPPVPQGTFLRRWTFRALLESCRMRMTFAAHLYHRLASRSHFHFRAHGRHVGRRHLQCSGGLCLPSEVGLVYPHLVQDARKTTRDGHDCLAKSSPRRDLATPRLQPRWF